MRKSDILKQISYIIECYIYIQQIFDYGYVPLFVNTSRGLSSCMIYHRVCNKINTTCATSGTGTAYLPEHTRSPPVFSGVRVARSLVLCVHFVCFVDRCWSFCTFSFGHCVVCSSICGF